MTTSFTFKVNICIQHHQGNRSVILLCTKQCYIEHQEMSLHILSVYFSKVITGNISILMVQLISLWSKCFTTLFYLL